MILTEDKAINPSEESLLLSVLCSRAVCEEAQAARCRRAQAVIWGQRLQTDGLWTGSSLQIGLVWPLKNKTKN